MSLYPIFLLHVIQRQTHTHAHTRINTLEITDIEQMTDINKYANSNNKQHYPCNLYLSNSHTITFKGTQRAFVLFLLLVGVLPGLPTCMSYSALPLLCDVAWASSSKFNAKVKQSDYVLGSIKVVVLILLFFFSLFWSVFTNGHTITQYTTENV